MKFDEDFKKMYEQIKEEVIKYEKGEFQDIIKFDKKPHVKGWKFFVKEFEKCVKGGGLNRVSNFK